ncbi:hypothetical protein [Microvirga pakistanensis]|uniref:hypothetical protein n=1 Tax=Microvirga pakistanensis TaxID=1682650 RepID=UPI00106CE87E|nr:hypothetical protein [Microvirga pakistanensis]
MLRIFTLFVLGIATAAWFWAVVVAGPVMQRSVMGIGFATIAITTAVVLAFALPAFILALRRKFLWLALLLAMLSLFRVAFVA